MPAREVESTNSHVVAAMGLAKDGQSHTAQVAMDLDKKHWVIADLVKEVVALLVLCATPILRMENQDLSATNVPVRLWKQ